MHTYIFIYMHTMYVFSMQRWWSSLRHSFLRTLFLKTAEFFGIQQV